LEPLRSKLPLVGRHKLTAYDASYLELAIRHDLPIAALDNALTTAAREAGVSLVQI
jgi:predicted nucleic acid-binding protein